MYSMIPEDLYKFLDKQMLIVASINFLKTNCTAITIKEFDIFIFFKPTLESYYKLSALMIHKDISQGYKIIELITQDIKVGLLNLTHKINGNFVGNSLTNKQHQILNLSIYRLSKISMNDILKLEPYSNIVNLEETK